MFSLSFKPQFRGCLLPNSPQSAGLLIAHPACMLLCSYDLFWSLDYFFNCADMHTVSSSTDLSTIKPGSCTCMDMPCVNLPYECNLFGYSNHSLRGTRIIDTKSSCNMWTPFEARWKPLVTTCCQAAPLKEKQSVLLGVPKWIGLCG